MRKKDEISIILNLDECGKVHNYFVTNDLCQKTGLEQIKINQTLCNTKCKNCKVDLIIHVYIPKKNEFIIEHHQEGQELSTSTVYLIEPNENVKKEPEDMILDEPEKEEIIKTQTESTEKIQGEQTEEESVENIKLQEVEKTEAPKDDFVCDICTKSFRNQLGLSAHKRHCTSDRINMTCDICKKTFDKYYKYDVHLQTVHMINPRHKCPECEKCFSTPSKLEQHIQLTHQNIRFKCEECDKSFTYRYGLLEHLRKKHGIYKNVRRTCKICNPVRRFKGDQELEEHLLEEHGIMKKDAEVTNAVTNNQCNICLKVFKNLLALRAHQRSCDPENPRIGKPTCKHCGKEYSSWPTVKEHIRTEHLGIFFQCELCGKQFKRKDALQEHLLRHQHPQPFHCAHCPQKFVNKDRLRIHLLGKHFNQRNHVCEICSKSFLKHNELRSHKMRVHTKDRPFKCDKCHKSFKLESCLKVHDIKMHTPNELKTKFYCKLCDYVATQASYLKHHVKNHHMDDSMKVKCGYCDKRFPDERKMKTHEMVHTGFRPISCECGQKFRTKVERREHYIKAHTSDRPFVCAVCNDAFPDRWQYRNHLTRHENEMGVTLDKSVSKFMVNYKHI